MKLAPCLLAATFVFAALGNAQAPKTTPKAPSKATPKAADAAKAAPKYGAFSEITALRLKAHLEFVAHDLLEGRDTPSRGLDIAAHYIATQLKLWGVEPGGENGTYFQTTTLPQPKPDAAATTIQVAGNALQYHNVVGIVRGSDPKSKGEYVAFGAHYDHVGKRGDGPGDQIWNGADDDGSGTVSILEIAHAFAVGPKPKRSLLFVWHAGEEKGLRGSAHFVEHPTVPIDKIVTQLNVDMVGRSRAPGDSKPENANLADGNSIYVIGSRMLSDDLGNAVQAVNKDLLKLRLDYKYDDPKDPEQFYYRSDQYSYASKGIPIAFFFNGVHEDYHQPGDEVSKIDFVRMEKVVRTIYAIGWHVANTPARPKVNKPIQWFLLRASCPIECAYCVREACSAVPALDLA